MQNNKKVEVQNLIATQANSLIEATYPRVIKNKDGVIIDLDQKISTRAHKVSRLIVSLIKPDDNDLRFYKIDIATLKNYLGYRQELNNGVFYQDLKEIANRLNKQPIEIRPEKNRLIVAYFISSYELNTKTGQIEFEISAKLKPFLLQLKNNFTSVQLANIPKLSSGYSIRLYEILSQYRTIGKRYFDDIAKLQGMLGSNYEQYGHFKARILDPAQKDMLKNTNIMFKYEETKTGRKITGLTFHIKDNTPASEKENNQLKITFSTEAKRTLENELTKLLKQYNISEKKIEAYIAQGFDIIKDETRRQSAVMRCSDINNYYKEKILLLQAAKPEMDNPAGFLIKALQEDWLTSKTTKDATLQNVKKEKQDKFSQLRMLEMRMDAYENQQTILQISLFEKLASDEKLFTQAYSAFLKENDSFLMKEVLRIYDSPMEAYNNSIMVSSIVQVHYQKIAPNAFEALNALKLKIKTTREELKKLKMKS